MVWIQSDEVQEDFFCSCDEESTFEISDNESQNVKDAALQADDEDSEVDVDIARAHGPKTTTERRRAQNDIMRAFAANISASLTQKEVDDAAAKSANEEQLSIRDILAKQETTVRITNPRDYQTELFQRAKEENVIAVLDTGSGKTHIATLLLQHVLDTELEHRAKGGVPKIAFFLVSPQLRVMYAQVRSNMPRSILSISSFNNRMFCDAVSIKMWKAYVAPWALHCGLGRPGRRISPPIW